MKARIQRELEKILPRMVTLRQRLHQVPEESFQEKLTAEILAQTLQDAGICPLERMAGTGLVSTICGHRPGPAVALRADMDALRIEDRTGKSYASRHPGLSHSCGHDGHMASVMGAALVVAALRDHLTGSLRVIFQPAEENGGGARAMIEAGALGPPVPGAVFAVHAWPDLACGMVASRPEMITSGNDLFCITVKGRGGHGARPHESLSPIVTASRIVQALSGLSRFDDSGHPICAVSVGMIQGGEQANTIPDEAVIRGTIRSSGEDVRRELLKQVRDAVGGLCAQDAVAAETNFQTYCPPVLNDPGLYRLFEKTADELLGPESRAVLPDQSMGSEDFGYFTREIPGLLIRLGVGAGSHRLHTGGFDFSDGALKNGITLLAGLVFRSIEETAKNN